jgi:glycosyltransferase involved in cell wall biosynthesis
MTEESHTTPLVSVVIPGYKDTYILETIDSVLKQTYPNIEIIVIDDGSPNNLPRVLKDLIEQAKIRYYYQENKKMAAAKNHGVNRSNGELIAFIDDDDLWDENKIALQVEAFSNGNVGLVYTFAKGFTAEQSVKIDNFRIEKNGKILKALFLEDFICNSSVMVRKGCLDKVGGFNESQDYFGVDDTDLWTRISFSYDVACIPSVLTQLRLHDARFSSNSETMQLNDIHAKSQFINEFQIPSNIANLYYQRIYFELGYSQRKINRKLAIKYYIKSLRHRRSKRAFLSIIKTIVS